MSKKKTVNPNIELVRLVTAGSVDDGKSTMIGRLLFDCQSVYEDQIKAIKKTAQQKGKSEIDYSLLLDGLSAEREQGITIDVAYRYFATPKRRYIIADVPGHEQYTRNMVTGASSANLAMLLVDGRKGMLIQSKRHLFIASLLGIPHILLVINKMDLIDYQEDVFERIKEDFTNFAAKLNIHDLQFIPASALKGDMIVKRNKNMTWYDGPTLLSYLENLEITSDRNLIDFRFPVQCVLRPNQDFRGYAGMIESGTINKSEEITVLPSNQKSKIKSVLINGQNVDYGFDPQSVVLTLNDNIDISRGDMIVRSNNLPTVSCQIEAVVSWFVDDSLSEGKKYIIKHTTLNTKGIVKKLLYKINIDDLHRQPAEKLDINEIGRVQWQTLAPLKFDSYKTNRSTGSFIIIDEITNNTVGAGLILHQTQKQQNAIEDKKGLVLWFTGLSGSGKSAVADKVYQYLKAKNIACQRLDGDVMREALSKDLGYTKEDRDKNIERAAFVAKLLSSHGVCVLASFISPYSRQRNKIRKEIDNFIEIFIDTPLGVCERRDVKGLYQKARAGKIANFTGISDPYEAPKKPELIIYTEKEDINQSAQKIIDYLEKNNLA